MSLPSTSKEIDPWADVTLELDRMPHKRTSTSMVKAALGLFHTVGRFIDDLSAYADDNGVGFGYIWTRVRAFVPLQIRLCAEQIFWDRGGEWRRYISGFSPIKGAPGFGATVRIKPTTKPASAFEAREQALGTGAKAYVPRKPIRPRKFRSQ
jgi:hypothetical protein